MKPRNLFILVRIGIWMGLAALSPAGAAERLANGGFDDWGTNAPTGWRK